MGTLTGDTPSLPDHCRHKLATSCRLTALPVCCACQDKRAHTEYYTTYVDGVGLVLRGARWDRYCFFCKTFWSNRVAATEPPISISRTRIPEVPDQNPFLDKWFDYHRGYRIDKDDNGVESRTSLVLEKPWRDVDPGFLPVLNEQERRMTLRNDRILPEASRVEHVSVDTALNELLEEAEQETQAQSDRDRERVSRLHREASERDLQEAQRRLREAERACTAAQLRKQRATCELEAAERELRQSQNRRRAAARDEQAYQYANQMLNRQTAVDERAAQRIARVWGTREDVQSTDYTSPVASMFTRAYDRYRIAEDVRAEERASSRNEQEQQRFLANLVEAQYPALFQAIRNDLDRQDEEEPVRTLDDADDNRPPPKSEEELNIKLECKVCLQQVADTACLPCGHLVMCIHCAEIVIPTRRNDHTTPIRRVGCPLCRRQVTKRVRIFTS